ncbi:MAG: glycosyl-4,4'-diaponeurosporenoate acyltransferase [Chitinivibrionales bacterium]
MKTSSRRSLKEKVGLIAANSLAWLTIHMGIAFLVTRLPVTLFKPDAWLFHTRPWEKNGELYDTMFKVARWKGALPDGATWFIGGFAKARLKVANPSYLARFISETCRGESVHWLVIAVTPIFLLWNSFSSFSIMIVYALASNMPCIIAQRYNRPRLSRLLSRVQNHAGRDSSSFDDNQRSPNDTEHMGE